MAANEPFGLIEDNIPYVLSNDIAIPKGANPALIREGNVYGSLVNKLHLIKLANNYPAMDTGYANNHMFAPKTFVDLCKMNESAVQYDPEDFLYCKNLGFPINKLITLRRFPYPCTDNIYTRKNQAEPDIARMVTYFSQETNKLEDIMGFSYNMKWKQLTAEMEQASSIGDQSGFEGFMKKAMTIIDPTLAGNTLKGQNKLNYDPKHDQNKVYGPVDSLTETHIRDVGLEFTKDFDLTFEYEMRSISGRTPEFAFKDIIANVLATTYNNAKFWPGSRYWVGERPSQFLDKFKFMNPDQVETFLSQGYSQLKSALGNFKDGGSAIKALKNAMTNGITMALGKLLDKVGRPSILVMNSLLSGEPTGYWHLTIGNPDNPMMCIGNLICMGVDVTFPTDSLSYGDFPTKLMVKVKLKPAQPKDRAGIEMMFNMGKQRIYYNPKSVKVNRNNNNVTSGARGFFGFDTKDIETTLSQSFDFVADNVKVVTNQTISNLKSVNNQPSGKNISSVNANSIAKTATNLFK